jgi:glycosyltransferase involved in cell wall biosynthesis
MMKKVKVFLGAYINSTNAQNLSCLTLAEHLNKDRFEVYTLEIYNGNLERASIPGVKTFYCFYPFKISGYLGFLWGIMNCDVAFLPRGNMYKFNNFLLRFFKKKSFKTIENILDETVLPSIISVYGSMNNVIDGYSYCDKLYSITYFMKTFNNESFGLCSENRILYLATDTKKFFNPQKEVKGLTNIVFIGNDMLRKGIFDYLELAKMFPSINFNIVGSGQGKVNVKEEILRRSLKNTNYYSMLNHDELINLLSTCDLHILPSRSEGFPKVILETAAAGVPSFLYGDYGADEWIESWNNGVVVSSLDEMANGIEYLHNNPDILKKMSQGALELSKKFDIRAIVKDYEEVIQELNRAKK